MGDMIKYGIKVALSISVFIIFFAAIGTLFNFISMLVVDSAAAEVLHIIANCLPLNSGFWAYLVVIFNAIVAFLIARKTWELYTMYQVSTS